MAGIDARNGHVLDGFEHVLQSLEKILNTPQGARVMREWFGNPGLKLLGENMTDETILLWFNIIYMLIELFEPRLRVVNFQVEDLDRQGFADFTMNVEYRPYAHLDWVQAAAFVSINDNTVSMRSAA
jgi:phage baseplate assembly protein W